MCQINAAFGHHSDQISIAELVAEVPANVQYHDLVVEVATFEQLFDRYELRHFSIIAKPIRVCTRARERIVGTRKLARLYTTSSRMLGGSSLTPLASSAVTAPA